MRLKGLLEQVIQWALHTVRDQLGIFVLLGALAGLGWLVAARGLHGPRLALWLLVPALLAGAFVCWLGPDRLFPKVPFEGPSLITLSDNHAITLLDLPGVLLALTAAILGGWLIRGRLRA